MMRASYTSSQQQPGRMSVGTMSYRTAFDSPKPFYDGELQWKTGKISKTKIYGTVLSNDSGFYVIDSK